MSEYKYIDKAMVEINKKWPGLEREFVRDYFAYETARSIIDDNEVWDFRDMLLTGEGLHITMELAEEYAKQQESNWDEFIKTLIRYELGELN